MVVTRGGSRQSLFALLTVFVAIIVSFGILGDLYRVGNVIIQMLLFGGLWIIANIFRTRRVRLESAEQVLVELEAEQDRLAREAVQDERARIARDLHDIISDTR
jgi:signal transduction histidine kinase